MRERIKAVTAELLVRHGHRGLRFRDVAAALGTTRANLHYHVGTKPQLIEEVIDDYLRETVARFRAVWAAEDASLEEKIEGTMAFNRERHSRFNPPGTGGGRPWSLIARMRLERDLLDERSNARLTAFGAELEAMITEAVRRARERGELAPDAPVRDIALQLVCIANSAGSITIDTGSFEPLEQLYLGFARIVAQAYGRGGDAAALHATLSRAG
jgi:TetR/AcrR family transcriptional regulator, transcriptional repressor for nem operon